MVAFSERSPAVPLGTTGPASLFAVMMGVGFAGFRRMVMCVMAMARRGMGMMRRRVVILVFIEAGGFAMMVRGLFMMFGGVLMMFAGRMLMRHEILP